MNVADLQPLALQIALAIAGFIVLLVDLFLPAGQKHASGQLTALLVGGILIASFYVPATGSVGEVWVNGPWTLFIDRLLLATALITTVASIEHVARTTPYRQGEYWVLVLMSLLGMTMLPGARDLVLLVVCFELMGIPLYFLAAWGKNDKGSPYAGEAGLKLYYVGAVSTAITLFGLALTAGMAGTTSLSGLAAVPSTPLFSLGMMLVLAGIGFKIGLVPFHMWVPDTYQGAETPFVAFLSVAPKIAGVAALCAIFFAGFGAGGAHARTWSPALITVCVATMALGNLLAVPQTNVKRLLAYSGVAQMGYVLLALTSGTSYGRAVALFYLAGYVVTNVGAFLVVHAVQTSGSGETLQSFDGLARRSPWLAGSLLIFLLSLAGIPFVVGFWAKLYAFMAAWQAGLAWLVAVGAVLAVVGLFYYLQIARAAYLNPPTDSSPIRVSTPLTIAILVCVLAVIAAGAYPGPLVDAATSAATFAAGQPADALTAQR